MTASKQSNESSIKQNTDLLEQYLTQLYGAERARQLATQWVRWALECRDRVKPMGEGRRKFTSKDALLIAYGDHIFDQSGETPPLRHLLNFYNENLRDIFSGVHLLPFFPSTSDAGFAVKDFMSVCQSFGGWSDIESFSCDLMFDGVFNHTSSEHPWFQQFVLEKEPYKNYYIGFQQHEIKNEKFIQNVEKVVRPRPTPLFSRFRTAQGDTFVWTTFSKDQVDVNFSCPEAFEEIVKVLLFYVLKGASYLRVDAVPFFWKELGTDCAHRPETHIIVKVMRTLLDIAAPWVTIITESNVPHLENISYFGNGDDEAQVVYNFSLAPLIAHAVLFNTSEPLVRWASELKMNFSKNHFLNFTSSHDGLGVRPLEGLVSEEDVDKMCEITMRRGGKVSYRSTPQGEVPYELNITWASLICDGSQANNQLDYKKYMLSHGVCMAFPGIPAIYFHNMFGAKNYKAGYNLTKHRRDLNRRKYNISDLATLVYKKPFHSDVYVEMQKMLKVRRNLSCLTPSASMVVLAEMPPGVFGFRRDCKLTGESGLFIFNFNDRAIELDVNANELRRFKISSNEVDLLNGCRIKLGVDSILRLDAYGQLWLKFSK